MCRERSRRRSNADDLRRIITSPVTASVLLALAEGPKTSAELAEIAELRAKDVVSYLVYYKRKGWVQNHSPLWSLTPEGERLVSKYRAWLEHLVRYFYAHTKDGERRLNGLVSHTKPFSMQNSERLKTTNVEWQAYEASVKQRASDLFERWVRPCAEARLGRGLEPEERDLLLLLTEAFVRAPRNPYVVLDAEQLLERFGRVKEYEEALKRLVEAGVVFQSKRNKRLFRLDETCTPQP